MKQCVKSAFLGAVAMAMVMMAAPAAHAQATQDLSVGFQFGHISQQGFGETFPYGWYADGGHLIRPMIAIIGEVGGIYKSENSFTAREYSYQGGVRVFAPTSGKAQPFGQILAGDVNAGGGGSSVNAFSLQFGAGANIKATSALNVRVGVDYRRDFFSDTNGGGQNVVRVVLGVVFPFSK